MIVAAKVRIAGLLIAFVKVVVDMRRPDGPGSPVIPGKTAEGNGTQMKLKNGIKDG
jgi:hypothetical protein